MRGFCLGIFLALFLTGCATAFHEPEDHIVLFVEDPKDLTGAVVWVNGKPSMVNTLQLEQSSAEDWGTFLATTNANPYVTGPGFGRIKLKRSVFLSQQTVSIKKDGYRDQNFVLDRRMSPYFLLNIANLIGFVVDLYSGFAWEYEPKVLELSFAAEKEKR